MYLERRNTVVSKQSSSAKNSVKKAKKTYTLTVNSATEGRVAVGTFTVRAVTASGENKTTITYNEGDVVTVTVFPNPGYEFGKWSGDTSTISTKTENKYEIIMKGDYTITPEFNVRIEDQPPGPGSNPVGRIAIIVLAIYLIVFSSFLLSSIIQFWQPMVETETLDTIIPVKYFIFELNLYYEAILLITVAMAGALGSQIHVLRSYWKYVGNRRLLWSWAPQYIIKPFIGASLGLVLYFIIRAGFFTSTTILEATSFSFLAMAALAGMFTDVIVEKLLKVLELIFTKPESEGDALHHK
jgi:hypothetical protein